MWKTLLVLRTGESGRPGDKDVKELRYTSEVFFARVTTTTILKDSVPFRRLNIIEDAVKWALGSANLFAPLRPSDDYLAYKENFIEIESDYDSDDSSSHSDSA